MVKEVDDPFGPSPGGGKKKRPVIFACGWKTKRGQRLEVGVITRQAVGKTVPTDTVSTSRLWLGTPV